MPCKKAKYRKQDKKKRREAVKTYKRAKKAGRKDNVNSR
jgi:hypothetical protein